MELSTNVTKHHTEARPTETPSLNPDMMALSQIANGLVSSDIAFIVVRRSDAGPLNVLYVNDAFLRMTGYRLEDALGRRHDFLRGIETASRAAAELDHAFTTQAACDLEVLHYRRDGTPFWNAVTVSPLRDPSGEARSFLVLMRDVTMRRRSDQRLAALADRLHELAMSDSLTGIANRRSFDAMLEREWSRAMRAGTYTALALIDIDHFKSFNDQFGHPAGDACLRQVATVLQSVLRRPADLLARFGGEEFAILMPEVDPPGAVHMGERLLEAVREAGLGADRPQGHLTVSAGMISVRPSEYAAGVEGFIQQADRMLYAAKAAGRNRVHHAVFSE